MLRILGRKKVVGNPLLYGTSRQFLVHFGLNSLEDLPSIEDFEQFLGALDGIPAPLFGAGEGRVEPDDGEPEIADEEQEPPAGTATSGDAADEVAADDPFRAAEDDRRGDA
jgi:segregation and condensation protein B